MSSVSISTRPADLSARSCSKVLACPRTVPTTFQPCFRYSAAIAWPRPREAPMRRMVLFAWVVGIARPFAVQIGPSIAGIPAPAPDAMHSTVPGMIDGKQAGRPLHMNQAALAVHAPTIAGDRAVGFHDAMARHGDRDPVRRAGRADFLGSCGYLQALGDRAVGPCFAGRNGSKRVPNRALKRRTAQIELHVGPLMRRGDEGRGLDDGGRQACLIGRERGFGKGVLQVSLQPRAIIADEESDDALLALGDQDGSENGIAVGETQGFGSGGIGGLRCHYGASLVS